MRAGLIGTLLAGLALPTAATAACPASNQYNFMFNSQPAAALSYTNSYTYTATSAALGTANFTVGFSTFNLASNNVAGTLMPAITTLINDDAASRFLVVGGTLSGRTANIAANANVIVTRLTFPTPVSDVTLTASDLDYGVNQYRDWFQIVGRNGAATYTPLIVTPFGQSNATAVKVATGSSLTLGPATAPRTIGASEVVGTGTSPPDAPTGNIVLSFGQPITQLELRYGNAPFTGTENTSGVQAIGFKGVSWCPLPVLSLTKTAASFSDPANGTLNPKMIPGGDLIYTLTVTNSNGSAVDFATAALTDPLPAALTFYNGDIDDGGALTTNYEFVAGTSVLTFAPGNLTYSNNGGTTYAHTPAAGYAPSVTALRFQPTGTMAANSSFAIRFRVRIK